MLDSCKKTGVVLDSVVSSVEFVNCQSVQMQVLNKVPTVSIDKTDGCQIYLNDQSLDVSIVSAKSSEMNVLVPKDGDFVSFDSRADRLTRTIQDLLFSVLGRVCYSGTIQDYLQRQRLDNGHDRISLSIFNSRSSDVRHWTTTFSPSNTSLPTPSLISLPCSLPSVIHH